MAYALGIDIGTTFSAAAVALEDGTVELLHIGGRTASIPSVLLVRDSEVLVGDAAEAAASGEPTRVAREFKRRLGDPIPLVLGGTPYTAQTLTTLLVRHIYGLAVTRMGSMPLATVVTHPAAYSDFRKDALRSALIDAGIANPTLVSEPEAAAAQYGARSAGAPGEVIAIYDFGGGTFDIALMRRLASGFEMVGEPVGLDNLGGTDFDIAMVEHVNEAMDGALDRLDPTDPVALAALTRIRRESRDAKEALSSDSQARITVFLPGESKQIVISRDQLVQMIRPRLGETVVALRRAVATAGLTIDDINRVVLVGGSSRIPAIQERVALETGRPMAEDIDPEHAVALGAARLAARAVPRTPTAPIATTPPPSAPPVHAPPVVPASPPPPPMPVAAVATPAAPFTPAVSPAPDKRPNRKPLIIGGALVAVAAAVIGVIVLTGGDDAKTASTEPRPTSEVDETDPSTPTDDTTSPTTPDDTSGESTPPVQVGSPVRVGVLLDFGGVGDGAFNDGTIAGVSLAEADGCVESTIQQALENEGDQTTLIDAALADGSNLILGVGFNWQDAMNESSTANPDVNYVVVDGELATPNSASLQFAANESGFLAGVAAALTSKTGSLGFIGALEIIPIQEYEIGFTEGATFVNERGMRGDGITVTVSSEYMAGFDDVDAATAIARQMITDGADVVMAITGGADTAVVDVAQELGSAGSAWVVGVDTDLFDAVPTEQEPFVLTSALKNTDVVVQQLIDDVCTNGFTAGTRVSGLAEGGVGLSTSGDQLTPEIRTTVDNVAAEIINGDIAVPTAL